MMKSQPSRLIKKIQEDYEHNIQYLVENNLDIEQVKFIRGELIQSIKILDTMGLDAKIKLEINQGEVKANGQS